MDPGVVTDVVWQTIFQAALGSVIMSRSDMVATMDQADPIAAAYAGTQGAGEIAALDALATSLDLNSNDGDADASAESGIRLVVIQYN